MIAAFEICCVRARVEQAARVSPRPRRRTGRGAQHSDFAEYVKSGAFEFRRAAVMLGRRGRCGRV
eukprot:6205036-Pleurochrysis_carterae.AAC.1